MPYRVNLSKLPPLFSPDGENPDWILTSVSELNHIMDCPKCSKQFGEYVRQHKLHELVPEGNPDKYASALVLDSLLEFGIIYDEKYSFYV